jgi:hypothetical protein
LKELTRSGLYVTTIATLLWDIDTNLPFSYSGTYHLGAVNSAGECHVDIVEVVGSNPILPRGGQLIGCPLSTIYTITFLILPEFVTTSELKQII